MTEGVISVRTVEPIPLAAMRRRVTAKTITSVTMGLPVWTRIAELGLKSLDTQVMIYHDSHERMMINQPEGVTIDYGVVLSEPFDGDMIIHCLMTPRGRAAYIRHVGGYQMLPVIHSDIRAWCADQGYEIDGLHWEHRVVWHEEPDNCVTDIYYLLK